MEAKKRIGRPPKPDAVRKRKNQTFRIRDATLAALTASAEQHQCSISEEIERRVERSFDEDARRADESIAMRRMATMLVRIWQEYERILPEWADYETGIAGLHFGLKEVLRFGFPSRGESEFSKAQKSELERLKRFVGELVDAETLRKLTPLKNTPENKLIAVATGSAAKPTFVDTHSALQRK